MTVDELAARLAASKAGRAVNADIVRAAAAWALERHRPKDAEKAAKSRLHLLYGSYIEDRELSRAQSLVAALERGELSAPDAARSALALHGSTRERLGDLRSCYDRIYQSCGAPSTVADIACGLNPLSFLALDLPPCQLYALDAGQDLVALLNRFFTAAGRAGFAAHAGDALAGPAPGRYDLALVFKFLPLAERLRRGGARALLDGLDARHIVVSFPTRTLGGRNVGMEENYAQWFKGLDYPGAVVDSFTVPNELFLIVEGALSSR